MNKSGTLGRQLQAQADRVDPKATREHTWKIHNTLQ